MNVSPVSPAETSLLCSLVGGDRSGVVVLGTTAGVSVDTDPIVNTDSGICSSAVSWSVEGKAVGALMAILF